jgi:hypothetical protein
MFRVPTSSRTTLRGTGLPRVLTNSRTQRFSAPAKGKQSIDMALNPSAVSGTTTNFSPFSWADIPHGQDTRNRTRKARVSDTPEIEMSFIRAFSCGNAGVDHLGAWVIGANRRVFRQFSFRYEVR